MTYSDFRRHAHALVDWMADYLESVGTRPIVPDVMPGEIRRQLPSAAPSEGEPFEQIFEDFRQMIEPGMTHWNHPGWFAYFPANASPPSILAEMLTATMGAQCMSWQTSPAATELEQVVMDWLREMLGLPESFTGVIQDTASTGTLVALLSAREKATGFSWGLDGPVSEEAEGLIVYASAEAHSSIDKAVKLSGIGLNNLRRIPVLEDFSMDPKALEETIRRDRDAGLHPACVIATVGTTSSTAVDPLRAIGSLCAEEGIWFHVDAAYAGTAAVLPEMRHILDGVHFADSFLVNPHKWMLTNFDCTAYYVRDVETLLRTFQYTPEYLRTRFDADAVNFRDWGIQLGRRFRALKLWFVIRSYGVEGIRSIIRRHIALAADLRTRLEEQADFLIPAPSPFGLVCFRLAPEGHTGEACDALNERLLEAVNDAGDVYLTHTRLGGRFTLRASIGQWQTGQRDVDRLADAILTEAGHLLENSYRP
jgi:aromatic-L-amino-acid/L-tryptophan decarboxylase